MRKKPPVFERYDRTPGKRGNVPDREGTVPKTVFREDFADFETVPVEKHRRVGLAWEFEGEGVTNEKKSGRKARDKRRGKKNERLFSSGGFHGKKGFGTDCSRIAA